MVEVKTLADIAIWNFNNTLKNATQSLGYNAGELINVTTALRAVNSDHLRLHAAVRFGELLGRIAQTKGLYAAERQLAAEINLAHLFRQSEDESVLIEILGAVEAKTEQYGSNYFKVEIPRAPQRRWPVTSSVR